MNSRNRERKAAQQAAQGVIAGQSKQQNLGIVAGANLNNSHEEFMRAEEKRRADILSQIGARIACKASLIQTLVDDLAQDIYTAMEANGFWSYDQDNFGSKTALVHSELSEMLEANRKSIEHDDKIPDFTGEEAEAADTFIRLADMAGRYRWRLGEAIVAKMLFNLSRPYKHDKKY